VLIDPANDNRQRSLAMTFAFLHSTHQETPIQIPQIGLDLRLRIPPDATGGVLTSIETTNAPGFGPPLHRHRETEVFYVLEGRYLFEVDGRRFVAAIGDVVTAPGGSVHAFVNITDKPARQFIQILPGLDAVAFFLGLGEVMRDGKLDRDALNAFGKAWHVEFLGPPLTPDRG
jgi:quercetin dioxygenase-like cupin family protein